MPLNKEIEKQIAENNQKISALLAENENLLRRAGLNPPAANAALPPEKKIQFPSGYIRTVGHFKSRYHLSEIFPTKATRHIAKERRRAMRKLLAYFAEVDTIPLSGVNWHMRFHRNNQSYRLLMGVCYLTAKGLLQSGQDGHVRVMDYLDEQRMCRLFEKFILEFYRREYPQLSASASKIDWQLDDGMGDLLPEMRSDITLAQGNRVLIIDAKYYANILQMQFDVPKIHSGNLYQIFTYVKNKEAELTNSPHEVSGMLLYAKTDAEVLPHRQYRMSGNRIAVRTLDLDCDFSEIAQQLGQIIEGYF